MHVTVTREGAGAILDVFGPTVEILTTPADEPCEILGIMPPGVSVPMHAHPEFEWFFVVSGSVQVRTERDDVWFARKVAPTRSATSSGPRTRSGNQSRTAWMPRVRADVVPWRNAWHSILSGDADRPVDPRSGFTQ
jgi:hypothetical protein